MRDLKAKLSDDTEVVLWALSKLQEELAFYLDADRLRGSRFSEKTQESITSVSRIRTGLIDGTLILTKPPKKEKANAKAASRSSKR